MTSRQIDVTVGSPTTMLICIEHGTVHLIAPAAHVG